MQTTHNEKEPKTVQPPTQQELEQKASEVQTEAKEPLISTRAWWWILSIVGLVAVLAFGAWTTYEPWLDLPKLDLTQMLALSSGLIGISVFPNTLRERRAPIRHALHSQQLALCQKVIDQAHSVNQKMENASRARTHDWKNKHDLSVEAIQSSQEYMRLVMQAVLIMPLPIASAMMVMVKQANALSTTLTLVTTEPSIAAEHLTKINSVFLLGHLELITTWRKMLGMGKLTADLEKMLTSDEV